jgi:hypothetical protein
MTNDTLTTLSTEQLDQINGGLDWKRGLKFAGKKALGPVSAAWSGYDGVNGYLDAREKGKSVKSSLWSGLKSAVW